MASEVTASLTPITPSLLFNDGFELSDQAIIPSSDLPSLFLPGENTVEFYVYNADVTLLTENYTFNNWTVTQDANPDDPSTTDIINLDPIQDVVDVGLNDGVVYAVYNFINTELSSSISNPYYLAEISSDRTELRLKSNNITNLEISQTFASLKNKLNEAEYFDEFYISFGENEYHIGVNVELDTSEEQFSVLVKLYDALPSQFQVKDTLYVATKVAESQAFKIEYPSTITDLPLNVKYLQGPNTNLEIKDFINNSTELKSKSELLETNSSSSKDNLSNILNRKGVKITPNYSYDTFNEFVNFSSAKKRIENFIEKVEQIQSYEADIDALNTITGPTSESYNVSSSIASAYTNIENIVKNFDGYEYYLYYNTGSSSYPKTGSAFPYTLLPTTDVSVSVWLGSDVENSQYYGGILLSASLYDNNNQNWLYYTIPEFIRDNDSNQQYIEFSNMVGQHFDEIWLYTKAVSEKNNTTSDLDEGIPLQLADDAITSLGYKGFGNNYNNQDNFIGLTGEDSGSYVPPTGSEWITNYIAVNGGNIANYWALNYSYENYVEQINNPGWPYAIDRVSKEIFKRLYHNMSYLVKKKGTISGLRQLINIWGIPNTILRINEFGGKNKDETDDYDLWYNRYSYAFTPVSTQNLASASVVFPWMPLERNRIVDSEYIVPDSLEFRFKTTGYPSSSYVGEFFTQSLAIKKSDGDDTSTDFDFGIALYYEPPTTGSYSGSYTSDYEDWGTMKFYISGAAADGGVAVSDDIYLPFFDKGWWSVMLQRDTHVSASDNSNATTYTLYVKNKINNGWDGNQIGFEGSASIVSNISTSINEAWNKFGTGSADGIYLGGFVSGSQVGGITLNDSGKIFSGSLQEFRYYSVALSESIFNDFVMNPESIEGINLTGSLSSFDILNFRAPLGNELESIFTSSFSSSYSESMISMHPAITGAASILITSSFVNPDGDVTSSVYDILYYENTTTKTFSKTNTEVYFLDQPAVGIRNRISNKIEIDDLQDYGNTLSYLRSIQQDYQISRSYTEDISNLEVAFSPQDEVNDDIIQTFGYGVVSDALADPRFVSSSDDYYPQLRRTAESYFEKYTKGNVYDYLRLIKYFDNSIFKAIKNYVPARTSVSTGIVIKQHLLERNRAKPVQLSEVTTIARYGSGSAGNVVWNQPLNFENLELTSSIEVGEVSGSTGGSPEQFNYSGSPVFGQLPITQSWDNNIPTEVGLTTIVENKEREFYDGEYSGSETAATTQSLFINPFRASSPTETTYDVQVTESGWHDYQIVGTGGAKILISASAPGVYPTYDQLGYETENIGQGPFNGTGSIIHMCQHPSESSLWYITAIVLGRNVEDGGSGNTFVWPTLFEDHFEGNNIVYPYWAANNFYYNTADSLNVTPYFRFTLPSPSVGAYNTGSDVYSDDLPWNEIYSMGLGFTFTEPRNFGRFWSRLDKNDIDGNYIPELSAGLAAAEFTTSSFDVIKPNTLNVTLGASQGFGAYFYVNVISSNQLDPTQPIVVPDPSKLGYGFVQGQTITIPSASLGAQTGGGTDLIITLGPKALDTNFGGDASLTFGPWDDSYFTTNSFSLPSFVGPGSYPGTLGGEPFYIVPTGSTSESYGESTQGERNAAGTTNGWGGVFDIQYENDGPDILHQFDVKPGFEGTGYSSGDILRFQTASLGGHLSFPGGIDLFVTLSIDPYTIGLNAGNKAGRPIIGSNTSIDFTDGTIFQSGIKYLSPASTSLSIPNTAPTGVMSVNMQPTAIWESSSADIGKQWQAHSIVVSEYDLNGNYNYATLNANPSFSLTLTDVNTTLTSSQNILYKNNYTQESLTHYSSNNTFKFAFGFNELSQNSKNSTQTTRVSDLNPLIVGFDPYIDPSAINFENSDYYATLNNFNDNRSNTYIMNVEYENGITTPSNLDLILNRTAERTQTPDSNYTMRKVIRPRYLGSKLTSANYNFFTAPTSSYTFLNGTTGSWDGDTSYGKNAAISKNPIYIAHFKSSKENYEVWDTYTFRIDSLIEVPTTDVRGTNFEPKTLKLDGSNDNLAEVVSTFEKDRNVGVAYNRGKFNRIDYTSLKIGDRGIFQGGLEYNLILGTETSKTEAYLTCSFNTASWAIGVGSSLSTNDGDEVKKAAGYGGYGENFFLSTGSGFLRLGGGYYAVSQSYESGTQIPAFTQGAGLGLIHTLNVAVSMSNFISFPTSSGGNSGSLGIPRPNIGLETSKINSQLNRNYWVPFYSGSNMTNYEDFQIPFIIKRGDEIRVTWNITGDSARPLYETQDFTVSKVTTRGLTTSSIGNDYETIITNGGTPYSHDVYENSVYDRIEVTPDPSTFEIPDGQINQFTIRRRVEADDRVIVYQSSPSGSLGFKTLSGQGYLIPNDLSPTQKRNVQTMINQLTAKNQFIDSLDVEPTASI